MIAWFKNNAPIRTKFKVLVALNAVLALISLIVAKLSADAAPGSDANQLLFGGAVVMALLPVLVMAISGKLISDPYVATVVRMEGLAAGDLTSPIDYQAHTDCVGRLTRAMAVFKTNAEKVQQVGAAGQHVVEVLGAGLSRLAARDLSYRINESFPGEYEALRRDYNRAMEAISEVMSAVSAATNGINNGAVDIRQASDDLSQRTEQQAASLEQTAAAMDEITSTVRETAAGASRANEVVWTYACRSRRLGRGGSSSG